MGQNQSSDEDSNTSENSDELPDEEGLPRMRCIVSDPGQPHNLSTRYGYKVKRICFSCGKKGGSWRMHYGDDIHYSCTVCDLTFHKECLEFPSKMIHPYHPQHPLTFTFLNDETGIIVDTNYVEFFNALDSNVGDLSLVRYLETTKPNSSIIFDKCTWCRKDLREWFYRCSVCNFSLDFHCAQNLPPLTIQNPNSHHHPIVLFPQSLSFPCCACGLINMSEPSYACYQCNYFVHQSCIDLPRVIKLTRHPHRLFHTPYLPAKVSTCRVCYKNIDIKYGHYSCNHGDCSYVYHSKCATRRNVWNRVELEWEPEESDKVKDIAPYKKVGGGLIDHFYHPHHYLKLEKYDRARDSKKQCQACMRPINSSDFYSCIECDFFLHEVCANLPRELDHVLYIYSLSLDPVPINDGEKWDINSLCSICHRLSSGLMYINVGSRSRHRLLFQADINCILVPEYSIHESHPDPKHPLFISIPDSRESKFICHGCKRKLPGYHLQCTSCEYAICYKCATIPHEVYHKYDEDPLTLCYGEDRVDDNHALYWCEVCEKRLDPTEWFYTSSKNCTTIHRACLFGDNVYMKPGHAFTLGLNVKLEAVDNGGSSRPTCHYCQEHCPDPIYYKVNTMDQDTREWKATEVKICSPDCLRLST